MRTLNSRPPTKITTPRAFKVSDLLLCEEEEMTTASGRRKTILENRQRRFAAMITGPKKRKALEDRRPTIKKCLEDIQANGAPENHTEFIAKLRGKGAFKATRTAKSSTGYSLSGTRTDTATPVSNTTARDVIRSTFGLKGRRGKKGRPKKR